MKKVINNIRRSKKRKPFGFTLVETILAISIIALVITAAAELTQSSLRTGRTTMNQFIAYHLAEEGLELVRNMRDTNWLQNRPWNTGLGDGLYAINETAGLSVNNGRTLQRITTVQSAPEIALTGNATFKRGIEIQTKKTPDDTVSSLTIKSTVSFGGRTVSLTTELTDWKKGPL